MTDHQETYTAGDAGATINDRRLIEAREDVNHWRDRAMHAEAALADLRPKYEVLAAEVDAHDQASSDIGKPICVHCEMPIHGTLIVTGDAGVVAHHACYWQAKALAERDAALIAAEEYRQAFIRHRTATHTVTPMVCLTCQESDAILARPPLERGASLLRVVQSAQAFVGYASGIDWKGPCQGPIRLMELEEAVLTLVPEQPPAPVVEPADPPWVARGYDTMEGRPWATCTDCGWLTKYGRGEGNVPGRSLDHADDCEHSPKRAAGEAER